MGTLSSEASMIPVSLSLRRTIPGITAVPRMYNACRGL